MKEYIIYKITNTINGKIYIGRTVQSLKIRWDAHRRGIYAEKNKHLRLYKAFKKYGIENFKIEKIDQTDSFESLKELEGNYILKLESHKDEIGYNMSIDTNKGLELISKESIDRKIHSLYKSQIKRSKSKYGYGVSFDGTSYRVGILFNRIGYGFSCKTPDEAKIGYDKLAIYFHGEHAILNHPDIIHSKEDIEAAYNKALNSRNENPTSNFIGVSFDKSKNCFVANINKNKQQYYLGQFKDEKEAAFCIDKARYYLYGESQINKLNFPERIDEYKLENLEQWFEKITKNREIGVRFEKRIKKYFAQVHVKGRSSAFGYFENKEDAVIRRDLVVLYYELDQPLNYPEKLEEYKKIYKKEVEDFLKEKKKYKGIFYNRKKDLYTCSLYIKKQLHYFGSSRNQIEAAKIYDRGCYELLHDLSKLNFPEEISDSLDYQI